jgi:hypothetical protein
MMIIQSELAALDVDEKLRRLSRRFKDFRKWRLFACGCCRQVWPLLDVPSTRRALEVVEKFADGQATVLDVFAARYTAQRSGSTASAWAAEAVATLTTWDTSDTVFLVAHHAARALREADRDITWAAARLRQAALVLDIFDRIDKPTSLDPRWLSWNDGMVRKMADAIYREHRFADMPILADALEEAGCDRADLLDHCRKHPEHARACWLVDAIRADAATLQYSHVEVLNP